MEPISTFELTRTFRVNVPAAVVDLGNDQIINLQLLTQTLKDDGWILSNVDDFGILRAKKILQRCRRSSGGRARSW